MKYWLSYIAPTEAQSKSYLTAWHRSLQQLVSIANTYTNKSTKFSF